MKPYEVYQYLEGEKMTERDKKEINSKFWNKGKWDNFVVPFLPEDCKELSLVDMGCNAGLFLKLAEDKGFRDIIGVDSNLGAIERGLAWRDKNGSKYKMFNLEINNCIDELPVVDYTVLANAHYYFTINDFIYYLDELQYKTRYCIVVTDHKNHLNRCWARADIESIRGYFKNWEEIGFIDEIDGTNDLAPRKLRSLCFKSKFTDKLPIKDLDSSNHVQDQFYAELDKGTDFKNTRYYGIIKKYRVNWSQEKLDEWFKERIKVYEAIKKDGLKKTIMIDSNNMILDGNHRYGMIRNLGYKNIFVRKV
ncbi:MAG: hypothetical protein Q8L27_02465 [archaeon]|nr:hypothetical protein [archaeon]